jgi:hypothetical protein
MPTNADEKKVASRKQILQVKNRWQSVPSTIVDLLYKVSFSVVSVNE